MGRLVVGGFGLWVMAVGGLRWADQWWVGSGCGLWWWVVGGSAGDGRISDGESVVVPISVLICFYLCFSVLVVDSAAIVG